MNIWDNNETRFNETLKRIEQFKTNYNLQKELIDVYEKRIEILEERVNLLEQINGLTNQLIEKKDKEIKALIEVIHNILEINLRKN